MAVPKIRSALLRQLNECRILNTVRMHQPISRAGLGREIRLAMPTVMRIVDTLLEKGWLIEVGADDSTGGRPAILLQLQANAAATVGIELGRVYTRLVCVNLLCEVIREEEVETASFADVNHLVGFVTGFLARANTDLGQVVGIGVAAPGPLDPIEGTLLATENIPVHWQGLHLVDHFKRQLNIPTYLANDANAAALGETWFGLGNAHQHLLFVLADAGVGAGLAINRSIYCGASNQAGEFSHTIVDIHGEQCECGRRGCLDTAVSAYSMMRDVKRKRTVETNETLTSIIEKASLGIQPDRDIVDRALVYLATGIFNFTQIFDPDIVILGGRTLLCSEYMIERTQQLTRQLYGGSELQIVSSQFGINAVAIGAAALVLQQIYDHTQLISLE